MRRLILACVALGICAGASNGITYTWTNHSTAAGALWDTAANWSSSNPGTAPGRGDAVIINTGGRAQRTVATWGVTTVGSLVVDNGSWTAINDASPGKYVIKTLDNATTGATGDFLWRSTHGIRYPIAFMFDVSGNFLIPGTTGTFGNTGNGGLVQQTYIVLRGPQDGSTRAFRYGRTDLRAQFDCISILGTYWDNGSLTNANNVITTVDVGPNGRIVRNPNGVTASTWIARRFIFEKPGNPQGNLPNIGDCVDFVNSCTVFDNNPAAPLVVTGGVTYPRHLTVGSGYFQTQNNASVFNWKIKGGNLATAGDFMFQNVSDSFARGVYWLSTIENGTTTSDALTVNGNVTVGTYWNQPAAGGHQDYGLKLNASAVRIGGSLFVGTTYDCDATHVPTGAIDFGSSTVRLGKDLTIRKPSPWMIANWSPGTSTFICDGNGTVKHYAQTLTTRGLPFYNFVIDNFRGSVTQADNLVLKGNFDLVNGTFTQGANYLIFQGGQGTTDTAQQLEVDNALLSLRKVWIKQGSPTWVKLMSDVTITDNLNIDSNCELILNGFHLYASGSDLKQDFFGPGVNFQTSEGGFIVSGPVPEPATLLLLGSGAVGFIGWVRRRRVK